MRKIELVALRSSKLRFDRFLELMPSLFDTLNIAVNDAATDGSFTIRDHGERGCVVIVDSASISRRAALAIARAAGATVEGFEVVGTAGDKAFKFRAEAFKATGEGELLPFEGQELDFDDPDQQWGGGDLELRANRVLRDYAFLDSGALQTKTVGYKRRSAGRPSTPRVATLLATLQKAKSHEAVPQPNGRVEVKIILAAGGKQSSFCTAEEYEEVEKILGGRAKR